MSEVAAQIPAGNAVAKQVADLVGRLVLEYDVKTVIACLLVQGAQLGATYRSLGEREGKFVDGVMLAAADMSMEKVEKPKVMFLHDGQKVSKQ